MYPVLLAPVLTPHGHLSLAQEDDALALDAGVAQRLMCSFARGAGHGLLQLGASEVGTALPAVFSYWREFSARYVTALCTHPSLSADALDIRTVETVVPPPDAELEWLAMAAPLMTGAEYLTSAVLRALWQETDKALQVELSEQRCGVQEFLKRRNPAWNLVGRVCFNLAENRSDAESPFAFLATYTVRLSANSKAQHLPLGQALREYEGPANRDRLLSLLLPVQRAAENCPWLKAMVDSGEIFHPLRWTPSETSQFLRDCPQLEQAGIVVRMPATWPAHRPPRPRVTARVGGVAPSLVGQDALLDFHMDVTLDGESLTAAEIRTLLAGTEGLALVRGRWVEVDREQLGRMIDRFSEAERAAARHGMNFGEAMRMLAGANLDATDGDAESVEADWAQVTAGPWLAETLKGLRSQEGLGKIDPGKALEGTLRPYQQVGMRWLYLLAKLGLGACLADDMGLGKTIQVLSLLLVLKKQSLGKLDNDKPRLLVAPASLLANWAAELERFAPSLKVMVAHTSAMSSDSLKTLSADSLADVDVVIASYGTLLRIPWLTETCWRLAVLDEAQAIKNATTASAKAVRLLRGRHRLALSGTPVENHLGELWSLFEFLNPGMLGEARVLQMSGGLARNPSEEARQLLAQALRPFILRRTKQQVARELPAKTEQTIFCELEGAQKKHYEELRDHYRLSLLERVRTEGLGRSKIHVLEALLRLRQAACHPGLLDPKRVDEPSAKLEVLLAQLAEVREEGHKALVFSQFTSLLAIVRRRLDKAGVRYEYLDGATTHRQTHVETFQNDPECGLFLISLKAGGLGLNLTAAEYVFLLDPWWNPAVEAQAVDRAHRIGQTRPVFAYRLIAKDTVEEKVLELQKTKRDLADAILSEDNSLIRDLKSEDLELLLS